MDPVVPRAILLPDHLTNVIVSFLSAFALGGAAWLWRILTTNKRARKSIEDGVRAAGRSALGIEEENQSGEDTGTNMAHLINILQENLQYERQQRQAEAAERARQEDRRWERVEQMVEVCRDLVEQQKENVRQQGEGARQVATLTEVIHNAGRYFDEKHREIDAVHKELIANQLRLTDYVRDNVPPVVSVWSKHSGQGRRRPAAGEG